MSTNFAINGFGRIGRNVLRASLDDSGLDIVQINDLTSPETLARLFKYDSVHGRFDGEVTHTDNSIVINGKEIPVSAERDPAQLPWKERDAEVILECTGVFTKRELAAKHLEAGAKKVLVSAPSGDADITLVYGVNHANYDRDKHDVVSNGSCTTNCLAPIAKVLLENFGIEHGLMTTIHSYTNDQRILDLPHKDPRRSRAAGVSMIPTTTGAAKALSLVIPELKGKLDGLAIRVPTPNVSLVDLVVELEKPASVEEVNKALRDASEGALKGVLGASDEPLVSIDFNGSPFSSVVDLPSTMKIGEKTIKILSWYDNEMGFSNRMVDMLKHLNE